MSISHKKGFTILELIFVLTIILMITIMLARPLSKNNQVNNLSLFRNAFRDIVFRCRLRSLYSKEPVELRIEGNKFVVEYKDKDEVKQTFEKQTFEKSFGAFNISDCKFFPFKTLVEKDPPPGDAELDVINFENKFSRPFKLKFKYNGQSKHIEFNEYSQISLVK